jgi:hypothetical protein
MKARILKTALMLGLGIGMAASATLAFAQGKTSLQVYIPSKLANGVAPSQTDPYPQIGKAKLNVSLTSGSPVVFTITDPAGVSQSFPALMPGGGQQALTFASHDTVIAQPNAGPGNPYRYELDFILRADSDVNTCRSAQTNQRTYTVAVRPADPTITAACLDSYDGLYRSISLSTLSCSNGALGANLIPLPLDDPRDKVASFDQVNQPAQRCTSFIPPSPPSNLHGTVHLSRNTRVAERPAR